MKLRLDHAGIGEVLKSGEVAREVHSLAAERAETVRAQPKVVEHGVVESVKVEDYVTDRAASAVVVTHPAGLPLQAKYGILTNGGESS